MDKIKFGCDDIEVSDDSAFESKASLIPANCIAVDMPDGHRKIYAYSGYLGLRLWGGLAMYPTRWSVNARRSTRR